jgi:hypothetical protein
VDAWLMRRPALPRDISTVSTFVTNRTGQTSVAALFNPPAAAFQLLPHHPLIGPATEDGLDNAGAITASRRIRLTWLVLIFSAPAISMKAWLPR